uniref:ISXO2-like transposase domain-containing protein n=1 Tax=Romanomermis culicivorax TaxID=13658 RepID=A0A915KD35_ROMCU
MGGPGEIVQIDESLMRGRRKYNRGRLLQGNRVPPARQNYGNRVVGPWVFGLIHKRADGTQDLRMFHVLRRNEPTLRAIIQRHVAPSTTIRSDLWRAYGNISNWPGFNYQHETVSQITVEKCTYTMLTVEHCLESMIGHKNPPPSKKEVCATLQLGKQMTGCPSFSNFREVVQRHHNEKEKSADPT